MDDGFNTDLKEYLHQCYLSDDNLRLVIEYLVKLINNIPVQSFHEPDSRNKSIIESISRGSFIQVKDDLLMKVPSEEHTGIDEAKLKSLEEELRRSTISNSKDKELCARELEKLADEKLDLEKSYKTLENQHKKLLAELADLRNKIKDSESLNEKLKDDNQSLVLSMKQMERNSNLQSSELDNLEKSMKRLSNKFIKLSSANDTAKDDEIERLSIELATLRNDKNSLERERSEQNEKLSSLSKDLESMKAAGKRNSGLEEEINKLQDQLHQNANEKKSMLGSLSSLQNEKDSKIRELQSKLSEEKMNSLSIKLLEDENKQLLDKLAKCLEDKSILELNVKGMKLQASEQEMSQSFLLQSNISSLKMDNKSLEMKSNSLNSEKSILNDQIKQLKNQVEELLKNCADNHADKSLLRRNSEESEISRQKVIDLEAILALMTEELNEKVQSLEEIRQMIKSQPLLELSSDSKCEKIEKSCLNQQLLISQKESEISYLKSKLDSVQLRKSSEILKSKSQSIDNSEIVKFKQIILELETRVDLLKQQLTDRSDTISQLQQLVKEKDFIIENAGKMIKTKNDSIIESEKLMHLLSLQNTNIKEELSTSYDGKNELNMLQTLNNNLRDEIQRLKQENNRLMEELKNSAKSDQSMKAKSLSLDLQSLKPASEMRSTSVMKVNEENIEVKNYELKEYSLKEIKNRDRKLDDLNLELRLKTDQIQKILIENRRLSDKIEDESQRTNNYEKNLILKEQLLHKILKEKEKIRATFITELRDKNEELNEKSKTVYFLNAEIHRLSSDLEIFDANLHTVKTSDKYNVTQSRTLEISENELSSVKEENASLKFCVNLKMAETEAARSELTIQQFGNKQLTEEINVLKSELTEREDRLSTRFEENGEAQNTIDNLKLQLKHIKDDFDQMCEIKIKLEKAMHDVSEDNRNLKHVLEELENEKINYRDEVERLRGEIDILNDNLTDSNEIIARVSDKFEKEQENGRRLSIVIDINEKYKMSSLEELNENLRQLDEIRQENSDLKKEIERLITIIRNLEHYEKDTLTNTEQNNKTVSEMERKIRSLEHENEGLVKDMERNMRSLESGSEGIMKDMERKIRSLEIENEGLVKDMERNMRSLESGNEGIMKDMERKIRSLEIENEGIAKDMERKLRSSEIENEGMAKELNQYQHLEKQLDERIQRKSIDCEGLRKENEELQQMLEKYQMHIDSIENKEHMSQLSLSEQLSKCQHLQDSLDMTKQQFCNIEEKWTNCNNNWLDKYGQLRDKYEKLECDYIQQQHHNDAIRLDQKILELKVTNQCQELDCLNDKIQQLSDECSRFEQENLDMKHLECENQSLQNYNSKLSAQIESLTTELVAAHTEIWNSQLKINDTQSTIGKLCERLNKKLTTDRRYGSQPLLDKIDLCSANLAELEQRDYNDLKTRYDALCRQVDTIVCQSKKKDKRIADLEGVNEMINFNSMNYDQMKSDYQDMQIKYQRLQVECSDLEQHYHYQEHLQNQNHEIQTCTDVLHDTILTQNRELEQMKLSHQMLADEYQSCCERMRYLEDWRSKFDNKVGHCAYLEAEFNEMRQQNDNLLSEFDGRNHLKQELIDMNSRMSDVMKCNGNLEQQLVNYHQKTSEDNQIIQNLNAQLHNLESYYENEIEQCRKDISALKDSDKSYVTKLNIELDEKNHVINCLNEETKSLQCELVAMQDQYILQCDRLNNLKDELNNEMMTKNELQQEYHEQCNNIDQLSAQLFDSRDLIERLTEETRRLAGVIDEKQCKINQLFEKIDKSDENLQDKKNEVRESKRNISILENDLSVRDAERISLLNQIVDIKEQNDRSHSDDLLATKEFSNEVTTCYKMIDNLRDELLKLNEENEKINRIMQSKDQQICDYEKDLEFSGQEIENLRAKLENRQHMASVEMDQFNHVSKKLSGELSYLQQKIYVESKSAETQTNEKHRSELLSQSPVSEYPTTDNNMSVYKSKSKDKSQDSDVMYTSTRSVSWKATNTDQQEDTDGGGVVALEQAIDDYNSILSDIDTPERVKMTSIKTYSSLRDPKAKITKTSSSRHSDIGTGTGTGTSTGTGTGIRTETEAGKDIASKSLNIIPDIIFVDIDTDISRQSEMHKNISTESKIETASIHDAENPRFFDVVQLLKNCNLDIAYDENVETPEVFFCRVIERYKEFEQYFLASLKIQFKQSLDDDTLELFDNFSDNMDNNRTVLKEQCRQLNDMLISNVTEINNEASEVTAKHMKVKDVKNLMAVIKTQQMQMGALSVGFNNLEEPKMFKSNKTATVNASSLSLPYEMLWKSQELCNVGLEHGTTSVPQIPMSKSVTTSLSVELIITGDDGQTTLHDITVQLMPSVEVIDNTTAKQVKSGEVYIVESESQMIVNDTFSQLITNTQIRDIPKKSIASKSNINSTGLSQPQSVQFQTAEVKSESIYDDDIQSLPNLDNIVQSVNITSENFKPLSGERMEPQSEQKYVAESMTLFIQDDAYSKRMSNSEKADSSGKAISSKQMSCGIDRCQPRPTSIQASESRLHSTFESPVSRNAPKHSIEEVKKLMDNNRQSITTKERTQSKSMKLQATESRVHSPYEDPVQKVVGKDAQNSSLQPSNVDRGTKLIQNEVLQDVTIPLESVQYKKTDEGIKSTMQSVKSNKSLNSTNDLVNIKNIDVKVKLKIAQEIDITDVNDSIEKGPAHHIEEHSVRLDISNAKDKPEQGLVFLQNVTEGISLNETKTKSFDKLDDSVPYTSVSNLSKDKHQLNNLDSPIDSKKITRIYSAENDYLNEKNVFHSYAINVLTDPSRYSYNSSFINQVNAALTAKAKQLNDLQSDFKFTSNLSANEKALISKVLGSNYTYRQQLDDWIQLQKNVKKKISTTDSFDKLKAELEQCRLTKSKEAADNEKLIKELQAEKEVIRAQLMKTNKIVEENDSLKKQLKSSGSQISKGEGQVSIPVAVKQSKIPLLKDSSAERPTATAMKSSQSAASSVHDKPMPIRSGRTSSMLMSPGKLVSPDDVRTAIASETSIDNLRRFANLLAEDNFDLSAEIEKLLLTIEKLRRQLKENCDILSETVEMLQNSENFVNNLEKNLAIETRKTQVISNRVDELNAILKQVMTELQRILKGNAPPANSNMNIQETCDYLLQCLKKLEKENKDLEDAKEALEIIFQ